MPKKTKKEKLLAMYHKKLRLLEKKDTTTSVVQPKVAVSNKVIPVENKPVNQFFYSDLKKSILLIILILGIVVSLYFFKLIK